MINVITRNEIVKKVVKSLLDRFQDNIISIFGIGSYFNSTESESWLSSDIDIIVILKALNIVPMKDWTNIRYEKVQLEGLEIWQGYISLEALMNKEKFKKESFANYEWSIIDLKFKENSKILHGKDIRNILPNVASLKFDYDDILARSLYHLDKSFEKIRELNKLTQKKIELTKAIFKFGFYLCLFYDPSFHSTSIDHISKKLDQLRVSNLNTSLIQNIFNEAIEYRKNNNQMDNFKSLRGKFTFLIFSLISKGTLHKTLTYSECLSYLENIFGGLHNIIYFLKKAKNLYFSTDNSSS